MSDERSLVTLAETTLPEGLGPFYRSVLLKAAAVCPGGFIINYSSGWKDFTVVTRHEDSAFVATMHRGGWGLDEFGLERLLRHDTCEVKMSDPLKVLEDNPDMHVWIEVDSTEPLNIGGMNKRGDRGFLGLGIPMLIDDQNEFQTKFLNSTVDYDLTRQLYSDHLCLLRLGISMEWPAGELVV